MNGKLHNKTVRIQRYSPDQLIAIIVNNETKTSLQTNRRKCRYTYSTAQNYKNKQNFLVLAAFVQFFALFI